MRRVCEKSYVKLLSSYRPIKLLCEFLRARVDLVPACLESLGLMQRTYDGSLDMRISMSLARLALNWVAA